MIAIVGGSGFIGTAIGLGAGSGRDLVARLTGGRFSIGATAYVSTAPTFGPLTRAPLATSCMPRHELHDAPVAMMCHQFAPDAACAATWAFSSSERGRDL